MINDPFNLKHKGIVGYAFAFLPSSPTIPNPPQRNLTTEQLQTLAGYQQTAGGYLGLNQQYQPAYTALAGSDLQNQLFGSPGTPGSTQTIQVPIVNANGKVTGYTTQTVTTPGSPAAPGTVQLGTETATAQRAADLADVQKLGPAATQAYLAANPYLQQSLNLLQGTENSPILQQLQQQAQQELATGGKLSPQEQDQLNQQTLSGFQQRGLATDPQSLGSELLNTDAAQQARLQQYQTLASGVQGLTAQDQAQASQVFQSTLADPYQAILGRSSGAGVLGGSGSSGIGASSIAAANALFNPQSSYAADLFNTNLNATASTNIANANIQAAQQAAILGLGGSALQGLGSAVGGIFSDKRLKTDIKKVGQTEEGIPIKEFRYKGSKKRWRGVVAQDVEKKRPDAVGTIFGVKYVDMEAIDAPFKQVRGFNFLTGKAA